MKKQFLFIFITGITFQLYAMELESKKAQDYQLCTQLSNLANETMPLSLTTTESSNIKDTKTYRTIALSDEKTPQIIHLLEEKKDMEVIPLHDTQKKDMEENFSSKCLRCCIPLTKEKIAKLTKKKIDINLYRENKCGKRKLIAAIAIPGIILGSCLIGMFIWVATMPDCHNSNSSLAPCWDWIW